MMGNLYLIALLTEKGQIIVPYELQEIRDKNYQRIKSAFLRNEKVIINEDKEDEVCLDCEEIIVIQKLKETRPEHGISVDLNKMKLAK